MHFNPVKVLLVAFAILFKIHSAYCVRAPKSPVAGHLTRSVHVISRRSFPHQKIFTAISGTLWHPVQLVVGSFTLRVLSETI